MAAWGLLLGGVPRGGVLRGACLAAALGMAAGVWAILLGGGRNGAWLLWGSRLSWNHSCQQPECMHAFIQTFAA